MVISNRGACSAGDVIVVPFPHSDRLAQKRRPALVVSTAELHVLGLVWAIMITSARNSAQAYDLPISDLARAGLPSPSLVRPTKIACIEPSLIIRVAGTLAESELATLRSRVRAFLGG